MKTDCITCENTNCLIKKNCLIDEAMPFLEDKHVMTVKKGQHFVSEGAPVHGLFFVYQGKVKVFKTGFQGREQIMRFSKEGEVIGYRGFGVAKSYHISAVAIENMVLCHFTDEALNKMLKTIPDLTYDFMLFYAEELNNSETKVKQIAQMSVREKVIDALLYFRRKFGVSEDGYLELQLSRKEIGDYAGTTDEQVIRVISSLKKEGLLKAKGKRLSIVDVNLMKNEIAEHHYFLSS